MSAAGPTRARLPPACSGAMYPGVPTSRPLSVIAGPPSIVWARPKSAILGTNDLSSGVGAVASDLGQNLVVPDLPGGGEDPRHGLPIAPARGRPTRLGMAQGANRRAALGRRDERPLRAGGDLLEPRQQAIVGGQLIDAAATRRAG